MSKLERFAGLVSQQQDAWLSRRGTRIRDRHRFVEKFNTLHHKRHLDVRLLWAAAFLSGLAVAVAIYTGRTGNSRAAGYHARIEGEGPDVKQGDLVEARSRPKHVVFSDGSRVLLEKGTQAKLGEVSSQSTEISLVRGALRVSVRHRDGAVFGVLAGPYRVRVTGTDFMITWNDRTQRFSLRLNEGQVRLSGGALTAERNVRAGESVVLYGPETGAEASSHPVSERGTRLKTDDVGHSRPGSQWAPGDKKREVPQPAASKPTPQAWLERAQAGDYQTAFSLVQQIGLERVMQTAGAAELLVLADAARFSGNVGHARRALKVLRQRFSGSHEAATAAFQLGRLSGGSREAVKFFRAYLSERPSGSLAREASGRLMELLTQLGEQKAARQEAQRYLMRYPGGPHATFARSLLQ